MTDPFGIRTGFRRYPSGMTMGGNIDLDNRPHVRNPDGSISTVRSMSFGDDSGEVLVPTVEANGRGILSDDDAIKQYERTGQFLGRFDTPEHATAYAEQLHQDQARIGPFRGTPMTTPFSPEQDDTDPDLRARLRRIALARLGIGEDGPDPVQAVGPRVLPNGSGLYRTSEIANGNVDRSPEGYERQQRPQRIIDAALSGLSGTLDPRAGGLQGFIGQAARAAALTRRGFQQLQPEAPEQPPLSAEMMKYAFGQEPKPQGPVNLTPGSVLVDPMTGKAIYSNERPETPTKPVEVSPGGRIVDPGTGKVIYAAPDRPGTGADKPLSTEQGKTVGYLGRAKLANDMLGTLQPALQGRMLANAGNLPVVGKFVGPLANAAMSPDQQQYENAANAFLAAVLRKESGATVTPAERVEYGKIYIDEYGDGPAVKAQKKAFREQALEALSAGTGPERPSASPPSSVPRPLNTTAPVPDTYMSRPPARGDNRYDPNGRNPLPSDGPSPTPAVPRPQNTTAPAVDPREFFNPRRSP